MRRRERDRERLPSSYLGSLTDEERRAAMVAALEATGGNEMKAADLLDARWWFWIHYSVKYELRYEKRRIQAALRTRFRVPRTA